MNAGMRLGLAAFGVGTVAAGSMIGGMAIDESRGEGFNSWMTPGAALAVGGMLPGFALGLHAGPGPSSAAFAGAMMLGSAVGAIVGRSLIGFAPPAIPSGAS